MGTFTLVIAGAEAFGPIAGFSSCGRADELVTTQKARNSPVTGRNRENIGETSVPLTLLLLRLCRHTKVHSPRNAEPSNPKGPAGAMKTRALAPERRAHRAEDHYETHF